MAEPFTNEPIPVADLPQLTDEAFVSVDPRYLRASLTGLAIAAVAVGFIGLVVASVADRVWIPLAIMAGVLGLLVATGVLRTLEVRRLAYQVRANDVSLRSGVITHRVESVPFARVQHVRVNRGAIERALGLATLEVSSAGPDITIPGLAEEDAARIKLLVTERAGVRENDVDVAPPPPDPPTLTEPPSDPPPPDKRPPPNEPAPPTPS